MFPGCPGEDGLSSELAAALSESLAGLEKDKTGPVEVDPEAVRLELRTLMNQINTVECERVSHALLTLLFPWLLCVWLNISN